MKIDKILKEIPGTIASVALIGGAVYIGAIFASTAIQNNYFHNISGTVPVLNTKLYYNGVEPYTPWIPSPANDKDGYVEVRLDRNSQTFLRYENLASDSFEGNIMVADSKGKASQFNEKTKYSKKILEEINRLKEILESFNSDGTSISDIVEAEVKKAVEKR